ncbi:hypothetical protein BT96DRAFT_209286 [Gymnopus androsaceus JB14]|uniref:Uncharacterized protein n=1 Tax=Gymnopus androsaceus JB14 TaxID=1447944 RepID=A0A6A4H9G6_9AGAR|nr:hypothetical protein BT96DRAFT_209286 [Gymnopus androsaceus JB14]
MDIDFSPPLVDSSLVQMSRGLLHIHTTIPNGVNTRGRRHRSFLQRQLECRIWKVLQAKREHYVLHTS